MSEESIGIMLSAATLLVIAATAVAAIVQLRHLRASNQLSALLEVLEMWNKPELRSAYAALYELPAKIEDPAYVAGLRLPGAVNRATHPALLVCDFWEQIGSYVKFGLLDKDVLMDVSSTQVANTWRRAWPMIEILRERGGPSAYENFEYLAVCGLRWQQRFPNGMYPRRVPRMAELLLQLGESERN